MRIDAHHHFWRYTDAEFGWIGDEMAVLRRDFLPEDLGSELLSSGMDGVVTVQARTSVEETEWLLNLCDQTDFMSGVVGWVPLQADDLSAYLDRFASHPGLKGVREVVQGMPKGFMADARFNRGVGKLKAHGLVYDLLIVEKQLPEAIAFVDRHPEQPMVLDHIAKPLIKQGSLEPWSSRIRKIAERPNVTCKLSGMVTEADFQLWNSARLKPFFEVVLDAFGPERLMFGSDWPVCLCACAYKRWAEIVDDWIKDLSPDEQAAIRGGTAARIYKLTEDVR